MREELDRQRGGAAEGAAFPAADNPFAWSLFDAYGAYPCCNDRHVSEFFPERFPGGRYGERTLGVDAFSLEDTIARGDRTYAAMRAQALGEAPLDERIFQRAAGEHEQLLEIRAAIASDTRGVYAANLPNNGAVPGLPDDAILGCRAQPPGGLDPWLPAPRRWWPVARRAAPGDRRAALRRGPRPPGAGNLVDGVTELDVAGFGRRPRGAGCRRSGSPAPGRKARQAAGAAIAAAVQRGGSP